MIFEIIKLILQIIVAWPEQQAQRARNSYSLWRYGYEQRKAERNRRASVIKSVNALVVRDSKKAGG